jgi:serine/threonine protein phosphatase PrpC
MEIKHSAKEFIGKRDLLEDRTLSASLNTKGGMRLAVAAIADGMGGEGKGQRASTLALEILSKSIREQEDHRPLAALETAFLAANEAVTGEIEETPGLSGMGTTLAAAVVENGRLFIANAGDSRIYLVRNGEIRQISRDHTLETKMRLKGRDEAYISSNRNKSKLTNHVGTPEKFFVDLGLYLDHNVSVEQAAKNQGLELQDGDKVVLCSDGLIKNTKALEQAVSDREIIEYVNAYDPDTAAQKLGELAVNREVADNVSVAIIDTGGKRIRIPGQRPKAGILLAVGGLLALGAFGLFTFSNRGPAAIPELQDNLAFASDVRGNVQFTHPGTVNPEPVRRGDIFESGVGATFEVVGEGYLRLGLADNSIISLGSNTKIELRQISNRSGTQTETHVYLLRGKLLINADIPSDKELIVFGDDDLAARVEGTIMGVFYDPGGQLFQVDCLEGHCVIRDADGDEVDLNEGELGEILGLGSDIEVKPARYEFWLDIADRGLIFTPTPTNDDAPIVTPTLTRTPSIRIYFTPTLKEEEREMPTKTPVPIPGCTDPNATNYNPNATVNDGSCQYPIPGCTDPNATNYNPNATVNDGSCQYPIPGCTDPNATNYDPNATVDDGSCFISIP